MGENMKKMSLLFSALGFMFFSATGLSQTPQTKDQAPSVFEAVEEYFELKQLDLIGDKHFPPHCQPRSASCFRTACETVDRFECDDQDEMNTLRRACRGSWDDSCLVASIGFLGSFEYDDLEEMAQLANSCRGVYDTECISYTCERLGSFGCDDLDEVAQVNRGCSGARR